MKGLVNIRGSVTLLRTSIFVVFALDSLAFQLHSPAGYPYGCKMATSNWMWHLHMTMSNGSWSIISSYPFCEKNSFSKWIQQILLHNSFWVMSHASSKSKHVQRNWGFWDWPSVAVGQRLRILEGKKEAEAPWREPCKEQDLLHFIFIKLTWPDHLHKNLLVNFFYME